MNEELVGGGTSALAATGASWTALARAAGEGQLRLEPGVAERCAVACETLHEQLIERQRELVSIGRLHGFGDLGSGQQLAAKFEAKAESGRDVLEQHTAILINMAATYRAAAKAYVAQEQANADSLRGSS